ncbi:MAG TPA: citryl-CoA lyase [Kofleriaceae bacterium]|jgi:citrate synthase|nr:citryl-CoA lyase [Kofleriaceae bacterium]
MPKTPEQQLAEAAAWWTTEIIAIAPGEIAIRGYPIEELIGNVGFSDMVYLLLRGELPARAQAELLEAALVASVDHGPQAPAIAISRMAVTCGLPVNGAMASAINVLDDVHGGAGQQCMELFREIAAEPGDAAVAAASVVQRWRDAGTRYVPGFGHRFHPVDPRTPRLFALLDAAHGAGVVSGRFIAIGRAVEAALGAGRDRPVPMNIDGVTAVIYSELGFEPELGRGIFILSRALGILAHAWEEKRQGARLKGPMPRDIPFRYTGPPRRAVPDRRRK